jgi:hypothetical protein
MSGGHFIQFRRTDAVAMCADGLPATERDSFLGFTKMLTSLLHHEFHARIEALKDAYYPVNPDADTRRVTQPSPAELVAAQRALVSRGVNVANGEHRCRQPTGRSVALGHLREK